MTPNLSELPTEDGRSHINIYSSGNTRLGRLLSNLANSPVMFGDVRYNSAEAFWYCNLLECSHRVDGFDVKKKPWSDLRTAYGGYAKKLGRQLCEAAGITDEEKIEITSSEAFRRAFRVALRSKVDLNEELAQLLAESTLPFKHYYYYGMKVPYRVVELPHHDWQLMFWESLRQELKEETT